MKLVKLIEFFRNHIKAIKWGCLIVLGLLIIVDAVPGMVDKAHAHTSLEKLPGFWSVFGFIGCVAIILLSKWYGHAGIMTREDYYDE
jgi:hypothetical protein